MKLELIECVSPLNHLSLLKLKVKKNKKQKGRSIPLLRTSEWECGMPCDATEV